MIFWEDSRNHFTAHVNDCHSVGCHNVVVRALGEKRGFVN